MSSLSITLRLCYQTQHTYCVSCTISVHKKCSLQKMPANWCYTHTFVLKILLEHHRLSHTYNALCTHSDHWHSPVTRHSLTLYILLMNAHKHIMYMKHRYNTEIIQCIWTRGTHTRGEHFLSLLCKNLPIISMGVWKQCLLNRIVMSKWYLSQWSNCSRDVVF